MDCCADATVKETPSHRSQCGGFAVSQNSSAQSSHTHTRCRFLLFILLTIIDCGNTGHPGPIGVSRRDERMIGTLRSSFGEEFLLVFRRCASSATLLSRPVRGCYETHPRMGRGFKQRPALLERACLFSESFYVDQILNSAPYLITNRPYLFC
jgi:hypothetical protein